MSTQGTSDTSDGDLTPTTQLRRGDRAIGTDGELGAVEQLVVDQDTGEQRGIVVRRASDNAEFEIPVDRVQRLGDREVYLTVAQADLGTRPDLARPYDPEQYVPVYPGDTAPRGEAERLAQDTGHPVVTSVEENAAELVAPENVLAGTDTAVDAPTTPRTQAARTDTAAPIVGGGQSDRTRPLGGQAQTSDDGEQRPERVPLTNDVRNRTPQPGPVAQPSATESTTGDLIGGRPTTGGMGEAATVTSEPVPPQDRPGTERSAATFNAPAQRTDTASTTPGTTATAGAARSLLGMTDDELANPDAALSTGGPKVAESVTRPYDASAGMTSSDSRDLGAPANELGGPREEAVDTGAPAGVTEPWRPGDTTAEATSGAGGEGVARATAVTPIPAAQPAAPTEAHAAQAEAGPPEWLVPVAMGAGAVVLAGGAIAGTMLAIQRRRTSTQYKAQQAATATKQGLMATAAATLAKAQELREQVLKPAVKQATNQAGDTSQQVAQQAQVAAEQTRETAKRAAQQVKQAAQQAKVSAQEARESAKGAQRKVQKTAKRAARRARWFRRGLLAGAAVALLYAPMPGQALRAQLGDRLQQLQSRFAS